MRWVGRISFAAFGILMASFLSSLSSAQEVPQRRALSSVTSSGAIIIPVAPTSLRAAGVQGGLPAVIQLGENKAQVITLGVPVRKIVIGNEQIADVHLDKANPRQIFILSKSVGATNVFFMDGRGDIIHQMEVRVALNNKTLQDALKRFLPNENINVTVYQNNLFLTGNVQAATAVADAVRIARQFVPEGGNVTNMLKIVGSQQVILQVRVAEMKRTVRKNLAADAKISIGGGLFDLDIDTTSPATAGVTPFGQATLSHDIVQLSPPVFKALEQQGLVKSLAEPTLTALSGETASFLSGGETPFPTGVDQNGNAIIELREFGIRLNFTPIVLGKGRINLSVSTEISAIDTSNSVNVAGSTVFGLTSKRTETTVDLPSGGSLMLSGLLEDDVSDTINGFPFLKDVPVLGTLFRSTDFQREETELVITVTAYLAKPASNDVALSLPTDGFEPASDIDIYLLGKLHRTYGKGERPFWKDPIKGPFGYIMK